MFNTVTRDEYTAFVEKLPANADWHPTSTINRSVMQIIVGKDVVAQAVYVKGVAGIKDGKIHGAVYQITV